MSGEGVIKSAIENAAPAKRSKKDVKKHAKLETYGLPEGSPVIPLGMNGDQFFYMDAVRQLRQLAANKHGRLDLQSLFVPKTEFLDNTWPKFNKDGEVTGPDWDMIARSLMDAAGRIGPIDVDRAVRGPGAWRADDGRLIMHCGDVVYCGDEGFLPGKIGEYFYPSAPAKPHPVDEDVGPEPAEEILSLLKTWNWFRPDVDPHLLLGWICAAMLGASLDWRPLVWITGDKATGKSTLHKLINLLMSPSAIISAVDASAAGIRQTVGRMSLPVALDELEAEEDNRKAMEVVKLARYACSGGQALRGGADHKGTSFTLMNCFLFSSILIPPMLSQDVSRMAILQLHKLEDVKPATLQPERIKQIGMQLRARIMQRWDAFDDLLETYRMQLATAGHTGRSADQFGTLMACHDLLLFDHAPDSDTLNTWSKRLHYSALSETEGDVADWQSCLSHLMTSQLDFFRNGERRSVGSWALQAAGLDKARHDIEEANKALANYGMRVKTIKVGDLKPFKVLQIANYHQGLAHLFRETRWAGKSGTSGVWVQSLRRVPQAQPGKIPTRFDGVLTRYTELVVDEILAADGDVAQTQGGDHVFS